MTRALTGGGGYSLRDDREKDDFYRTPAPCTLALCEREPLPPHVWEPACGDGAIASVLQARGHTVEATDLVDRGFGQSRRDFLFERDLLAPAIVTNPPFKLATEFVTHALDLGAEYVAIFQRLAWLEGGNRHAALWGPRPLSRLWVFSKRQTLWRGDNPNAQDKGGAIPFAWFVWDRTHKGPPQLGWIA